MRVGRSFERAVRSALGANSPGQIFIAEHGSWNRSEPIGYRVTPVRINDCVAKAYETFAEGWLQNGEAWGSPVDILLLPDGSMLVSGDKAGQIFRIHYAGKAIRN